MFGKNLRVSKYLIFLFKVDIAMLLLLFPFCYAWFNIHYDPTFCIYLA